ncbi:MAG: aminotransferase class III-fold pyridoxal phosphate-dependent enzyme [Caulobacteraceae bacterium]|nr:aminotransferase class III-fold pyridoxal phosphate-dependent enzyme [Caulobacter sp.]
MVELAGFAPAALLARLREGDVAAVVADPLALGEAVGERLRGARAACDRAGAALILDERLAAPRWAAGGAQAAFKVTADLAVYGPALANGRPFAALAGRRDLVAAARHLAPDAFAPTPQGLAAAAATAVVLDHAPVRAVLQVRGSELAAELERVLGATGAGAWCRVAGDPAAVRLEFDHPHHPPAVLRRRLAAELRARGVLQRGAISVSYAWGDAEVSAFVDAAAAAFAVVARGVEGRRAAA